MAIRRVSCDLSYPNPGGHGDVVMNDASLQPWNSSSKLWNARRQISKWFFSGPCHYTMGPHRTSYSPYDDNSAMPIQGGDEPSNANAMHLACHINALPNEVLGEVFIHYTFSTESRSTDGRFREGKGHGRIRRKSASFQRVGVSHTASTNPLTLSHVCGHWRTLSTSMPLLWSAVSVTRPTLRDIPVFALWLEHSGACPLDLKVTQKFPEAGELEEDYAIRGIIQLALEHRHRWRNISLYLFSDLTQSLFSSLDEASNTLPLLEGFRLDLFGWNSQATQSLCSLLYSSAKLQRIQFGKMWTEVDLLWKAPLPLLTSISLDSLTLVQLFPLLSACCSLEQLSVTYVEGSTQSKLAGTLYLPSLRSLSFDAVDDILYILDNLNLPSLDKLCIFQGFGLDCCPRVGWKSLSALLERSEARLGSLTVSCLDDEEQLLLEMLHSPTMAGLFDLSIKSVITDRTLEVLTQRPTLPQLLPELMALHLGRCKTKDGLLSQMALSRMPKLRTLDVGLRWSSERDLSLKIPGINFTSICRYM